MQQILGDGMLKKHNKVNKYDRKIIQLLLAEYEKESKIVKSRCLLYN